MGSKKIILERGWGVQLKERDHKRGGPKIRRKPKRGKPKMETKKGETGTKNGLAPKGVRGTNIFSSNAVPVNYS